MSTATLVSDRIRASILRGELAPGERLRQDRLAQDLGVSKIPVREALQRLAAEGLTVFESNRGFAVRTLSAAEAAEIYGLRGALEPAFLRRAIPRLSIVDLARAELALQDGGARSATANWAFHGALYGPASWARGLAMVEGLHTAVAPYLALYTSRSEAAERSDAQHRALLECCQDRRIDDAVRVLEEHLMMASEALCAFLEGSPTAGG